jgi:hypothetical protein
VVVAECPSPPGHRAASRVWRWPTRHTMPPKKRKKATLSAAAGTPTVHPPVRRPLARGSWSCSWSGGGDRGSGGGRAAEAILAAVTLSSSSDEEDEEDSSSDEDWPVGYFLGHSLGFDAFLDKCKCANTCDRLAEAARRRAAQLRAPTKAATDAAAAAHAAKEAQLRMLLRRHPDPRARARPLWIPEVNIQPTGRRKARSVRRVRSHWRFRKRGTDSLS